MKVYAVHVGRLRALSKLFPDTAQKMKFSIKNFFSKFDQIRRPGDLVTFAEEILNGKLNFLGSHSPQPSYP